jgi:hypothetical protein
LRREELEQQSRKEATVAELVTWEAKEVPAEAEDEGDEDNEEEDDDID